MEEIKVGIIGFGKLGRVHYNNIKEHPSLCVKAIADNEKIVDSYKNINGYLDHNTMIQKENLDAVFICVPHTHTTSIVVGCLQNGLDVFSEKPSGICYKDTISMERNIGDNILQFGYNHRYYSHIDILKKNIDSERKGCPLWFKGTYGRTRNEGWRLDKNFAGHGILLSQGIHLLDLLLYLNDCYNTSNKLKIIGCTVDSYKHESWFDDNVFLLLKTTKGVTGTFHSSCSLSKNTFELYYQFQDGFINCKGLNTSSHSFDFPERIISGENNNSLYYGNPPHTIMCFEHDLSWKTELHNFVHNIKWRPEKYDCSISEAKTLMKMVDNIYEYNKKL